MKTKFFFPFFIMLAAILFSPSCKKDESGDGTIPEIVILGQNPVFTALDLPYHDAGATAFDVTAAGDTVDITDKIVIFNSINTSVAGDYEVQYNVEDDSGEKAEQKVRSVKVVLGK